MLAEMIRANWKPGRDPVPPPDKPPVIKPPVDSYLGLKNPSFEDGWIDIDGRAQEPKHWTLVRYTDGLVRGRKITITPECVHKYGPDEKYPDVTLPEDEWFGGEHALVLDGSTVYKVFGRGVWKFELVQTVVGLKPHQIVYVSVPVLIDFPDRPDDYDPEDTKFTVTVNDKSETIWATKKGHKVWLRLSLEVEADSHGHVTAFFIDAIDMYTLENPVEPPADFWEEAWLITSGMQINGDNGIRLNSEAAIQQQIVKHNEAHNLDLQVVTAETIIDGKTVQAAESLSGRVPRRVYVWEAGEDVYWFDEGY